MLAQALDAATLRTLITVFVTAIAAAFLPALKDLGLELVRARQRRKEAEEAKGESRTEAGRAIAQRCLDALAAVKARQDNLLEQMGSGLEAYELSGDQRSILDSASVTIPALKLRTVLKQGVLALDSARLVQRWGESELSAPAFRWRTIEALRECLGAYIRGDEPEAESLLTLASHATSAKHANELEDDAPAP